MAGIPSENTISKQILERLQWLPQSLQSKVLDYVDFLLSTDPDSGESQPIKPGTLTGLRGILADVEWDEERIEDEYIQRQRQLKIVELFGTIDYNVELVG